jgi:hypothetical protein
VSDTEGAPDRTYPIRIAFALIGMALILWVMVPAMNSEEGVGLSVWSVGVLALLLAPLWLFANRELGRTAAVLAGVLMVAAIALLLVSYRDHLRGLDDGLEVMSIAFTLVAEVAILACAVAFDRPHPDGPR